MSGIPVHEFCEMRGFYNHENATEEIAGRVKNSAYEIIEKKQATYYGIAMSVKRICECIIRDEKSILPIPTVLQGAYGIEDVALSMPTVVGFDGVETHVPISLDKEERDQAIMLNLLWFYLMSLSGLISFTYCKKVKRKTY